MSCVLAKRFYAQRPWRGATVEGLWQPLQPDTLGRTTSPRLRGLGTSRPQRGRGVGERGLRRPAGLCIHQGSTLPQGRKDARDIGNSCAMWSVCVLGTNIVVQGIEPFGSFEGHTLCKREMEVAQAYPTGNVPHSTANLTVRHALLARRGPGRQGDCRDEGLTL
jgi:hypothetical protein